VLLLLQEALDARAHTRRGAPSERVLEAPHVGAPEVIGAHAPEPREVSTPIWRPFSQISIELPPGVSASSLRAKTLARASLLANTKPRLGTDERSSYVSGCLGGVRPHVEAGA
jgi:hypothetical protein